MQRQIQLHRDLYLEPIGPPASSLFWNRCEKLPFPLPEFRGKKSIPYSMSNQIQQKFVFDGFKFQDNLACIAEANL
jgi:hypothetical protein